MTPTSATGDPKSGFTLVEVMVVVTIMGLAASFVVLTAPGSGPSLAREADRLGARLARARQEAVLTNRTVEARVTAAGYDFDIVSAGARTPLDGGVWATQAWSAGTRAPGAPLRIAFDPTGQSQPVEVDLARNDQHISVTVDAAGNVGVHAPGR